METPMEIEELQSIEENEINEKGRKTPEEEKELPIAPIVEVDCNPISDGKDEGNCEENGDGANSKDIFETDTPDKPMEVEETSELPYIREESDITEDPVGDIPDNEPEILEITANDVNHEGDDEEMGDDSRIKEETDEELKETDEELKDAEEELKEVEDELKETDEEQKELDEEQKETNDKIEDTEGDGDGDGDSQDFGVTTEKPLFEHVNTEKEPEKSSEVDGTDPPGNLQPQEDPIAADTFEVVDEDSEEQGASEEICIIPDTEQITEQNSLSQPNDLTKDEYIVSLSSDDTPQSCMVCNKDTDSPKKVKFSCLHENVTTFICEDKCLESLKEKYEGKIVTTFEGGDLRVKKLASKMNNDNMIAKVNFIRNCYECKKKVEDSPLILSWETMEFCNELCLSKYQKKTGSVCVNCKSNVRTNCLGKYCVRFGYDIRQFCTSSCLEEYKKELRVCTFCQKDISKIDSTLSRKEFCSELCLEKFDNINAEKTTAEGKCSVCNQEKPIEIEFEHDDKKNSFCGDPCFIAFKFVNNITPGKCTMCLKYINEKILEEHCMYSDGQQQSFCSKTCQNSYIITNRKIVPCNWCKVKKYNFDMIKRKCSNGQVVMMCSLNCLSLYRVSVTAVNSKKIDCDNCHKSAQPMYHLTMSDATIRNFCMYDCVLAFQNQFPKAPITLQDVSSDLVPVPTGAPKRTRRYVTKIKEPAPLPDVPTIPVISSVQSLATNGPSTATRNRVNHNSSTQSAQSATQTSPQNTVRMQVIVRPSPIPKQRNKGTMCKVRMETKSVDCCPSTVDAACQTDDIPEKAAIIPIPVPIYVPSPLAMYSLPFPIPFPFPLPIPVPIFIPTTRNSANGIMKEIKKIQVKMPTDPFEAELLMMAEMVADDKKEDNTDSDTDEEDNQATGGDEGSFSPEPADASNTFGDDMLQMALKMATELDEPAVDLEGALTANTITANSQSVENPGVQETTEAPSTMDQLIERQDSTHAHNRRRKRTDRSTRNSSKRGRRSASQVETPVMPPPQTPTTQTEPVEKPDANMCLKYTFGVNAWKQWVTTKNAELEKSSRRVKLFKPEILQLTADELNYSLCLFVKEVRKPNGQEYAPDTIYYLCLGIQQHLFENGRIDNIFCDAYYEKFTDCLDEVARKFSVLYNDSHYIVTRVEEEHLWESKQLGAHSPHVLLSTLMFFNTKHFNLTSVDEHMQLSFSHIMKHWKRCPNQSGGGKVPASRNVLLRFYPPQTAPDGTIRKKKVYEQQENEDNPLRCPVKLYEFYLSKCPESVKTRNDVFYLMPERSCVPDSPVWYSTMPLPKTALEKMLHRVKMVKEINVALLTS